MKWYRLYNILLGGRNADTIETIYKKEWDVLFIIKSFLVGDNSKTPIFLRSAALFTEIMPRASTRQGLLVRNYK